MSLTQKEVTKMARLSRIEVAEEKKPQLANKIGAILDWMENLNEVDTSNVEPLANVHGGIAEAVLKNAPDAKYGYFSVPKMIE
jgi:aspartyl-tRNA(Asn)/glutamyl-tRNA(Gln) amidotransferase subunit C